MVRGGGLDHVSNLWEERIFSQRLRGTKCQLCTPPHSEPLCLRASVLKIRILCGKILRNVTNSPSSLIQIVILYILSERRNYKTPKIIHHFAQL